MAIEIPPKGTFWDATPAQKREAALDAELSTIDTVMGWSDIPTKEPGWRATRLREMLDPARAAAAHRAYGQAVVEAESGKEARREAASLLLASLSHIEDLAAFNRATTIRILLDLK
jgi:hypothetical protein